MMLHRLLLPLSGCTLPFAILCTAVPSPAQDWVRVLTATAPAAASLPRMAYDLQRGRCVMFGGWDAPVGSVVFNDTWEYDGTNWLLRAPAFVPTERNDHVMAYDVARGRTVMFSGQAFNFSLLPETLEWDGTNWTQVTPIPSPPPRMDAAMAYDLTRGVTVLFGGTTGPADFGDTWEWDGTTWSQITTANSPQARSGHGMTYDLARGRIVLFSGVDVNGNYLDDTWLYDGTDWTQLATDGAPSARNTFALVYDPTRARTLFFGGEDGVVELNDTWELHGNRWQQVFTTTQPQPNSGMSVVFDTARGKMVVFGGFDGFAAIGDTWEYGGSVAQHQTFGSGCPGSNGLVPTLQPRAFARVGNTMTVDVTNLPSSPGVVLMAVGLSDTSWGPISLPVDLTTSGMAGCTGYVSVDASIVIGHPGGTATWSLAIPNTAGLAGLHFFHQALSLDPGAPTALGVAVSNAGEATIR